MSPLTLRRTYMPRIRPNNTPAHPAAERAAAATQVLNPQAPLRPKRQTENATTANRTPRMTPFKPGFEMQTEHELANAFKRPPRMFKEDTPFYPWLPRPVPIVNFHLNYKF